MTTKSELALAMALQLDSLKVFKMNMAIDEILNLMAETLANNKRIEIRNFGSFHTEKRGPKRMRNPKTQVYFLTEEITYVKFRAGLAMRTRVNASQGNDLSSNKFKDFYQARNLK